MVNLYSIEIHNGQEYGDFEIRHKLAVAENMKDATEKAKQFMDENFEPSFIHNWIPGFGITLIRKVEGYKITVEKMEDEN